MQIIWGSSHCANCNNKHVSPIRGWRNRWLDHMGQEQVDLINLSFNGGNDVRGVMSPEIESSKAKQARWRVTVIRYKCVCVCVCMCLWEKERGLRWPDQLTDLSAWQMKWQSRGQCSCQSDAHVQLEVQCTAVHRRFISGFSVKSSKKKSTKFKQN